MTSQDPALLANGLVKSYGRTHVLRGLELEVRAGAVQGLVGLNGSGKTTTLECVLGLLPFEGGEIRVLGHAPSELCSTAGAVAAVFDSPCLYGHLTVRQTLAHAALLCGKRARPAAELEALLGLERFSRVKVRRLSLGNKKRAAIAYALMSRPELVFLDEPFSALDAGGVDDLLELVRALNRDAGTTFVLSSHQLPYLERICTHMAVLHGGRIAAGGNVEELLGGRRPRLRIGARDLERCLAAVRGIDGVASAEIADGAVSAELDGVEPAAVNASLVAAGVAVDELVLARPSLAAVFREVVGRDAA